MGIKNLFHNDSLQLFNEKMFHNILGIENVTSKKKCITIDKTKYYGYFIEKSRKTYFVEDLPAQNQDVLDVFPIKVNKMVETDYNKNVFYFITDYSSVKIPDEKALSFKELVDTIADFKHTNPRHWLLYRIVTIAGWIDRVNYRTIAERGFGKDSVINNVQDLVGDMKNIYGATFANLEYSLKYKYLIFNEMGNLKSDDKFNMQLFLLAVGAFANKYAKKSRATEDTLEEYDISKLSLGIIYNPPIYYLERGQQFFDTMFTRAVLSRFIPFYFEGRLDEKFDAEFDVNKIVTDNMEIYKSCISTLRWYRKQTVDNKYDIPDDIEFGDKTRRFERTFLKLCDYLSEYAKDDEKLYYELVYSLYNAYTKYNAVLEETLAKYQK